MDVGNNNSFTNFEVTALGLMIEKLERGQQKKQ